MKETCKLFEVLQPCRNSDYRNDKNLSNKNNILYAHSRLDKTMFGSLSKTLKSNWYNNKDNHIIRLSTEAENTMWQIFSI